MTQIRQPGFADIPGVYRVCFDTSNEPSDANPDLVGHVYSGPYVLHHPEFARVIADDTGIAGYVLGCPDTRAFEAWAEAKWWPALREQYPASVAGASPLHSPPRSPDAVVEAFPAHLHIDLLPRTQGHGYGRVLIEWLCAELAGRGIPGVHLGVGCDNTKAIAFYRHLGFATVLDDGETIWMARTLNTANPEH